MVALGVWVLLAALYILLTGQVSSDELAAAVLCGGAAALWGRVVHAQSTVRFRWEAAGFRALGRSLAGFPAATVAVGAVLARSIVSPLHGEITTQAFVHGRRTEPADASRRAVVVLAMSLAPDSYVLRLPEQRDEIDTHVVTASSPRKDARWPV